jgi:hypothetical protein
LKFGTQEVLQNGSRGREVAIFAEMRSPNPMAGIREPMSRLLAVLCLLGLIVLTGCESYGRADWKSRVGSYTMDDAIKELGPPDSKATTTDGTTVAQWLVARSRVYGTGPRGYGYYGLAGWGTEISSSPDAFLQLSFGSDGRLMSWKRIYK